MALHVPDCACLGVSVSQFPGDTQSSVGTAEATVRLLVVRQVCKLGCLCELWQASWPQPAAGPERVGAGSLPCTGAACHQQGSRWKVNIHCVPSAVPLLLASYGTARVLAEWHGLHPGNLVTGTPQMGSGSLGLSVLSPGSWTLPLTTLQLSVADLLEMTWAP